MARGEVDGIEFKNLAAPFERRASLRAEAAGVDAAMLVADDLALIGLLRGFFEVLATAFEEENAFPETHKLHGKRDARSARADDADIAADCGIGGCEKKIADHYGRL